MLARERLLKYSSSKLKVLYVCNHSGGKDSQAMFKWLYEHVPKEDIVVVHAHLPGADWEGTIEHIRTTIKEIPLYVVQANKTFFEMVDERGMWPSPKYRTCTSDLKRAPIQKFIRRYAKENGYTTVLNCPGFRAQESTPRKEREVFKLNKKLTTLTRTVYDVLPIHDHSLTDVLATYGTSIKELNKRRLMYAQGNKVRALAGWKFIWTYVAGMSRHSCKICIMSKKNDLKCSGRIDPDNLALYRAKEDDIDHQFIMPNKKGLSLKSIQDELGLQLEIF